MVQDGYTGKILKVNLSTREIKTELVNNEWARKYIGGVGLATRYLYEEIDPSTKPFDASNPIIFMTGPLCGTKSITSGRHSIVSLSPLTGIYGESDVGGKWGKALKRAGYDGVVITGKSEKPVYLWIKDEGIEIKPASHIWEKDTYELDPEIKKETSTKAVVSAVGTAAVRGALISNIMHEGIHARAAGRCGLGAVMADKKLKAIVVHGTGKVSINDQKALKELVNKLAPIISDRLIGMRKYGTARAVPGSEQIGNLPVKNFMYSERWGDNAENLSGMALSKKEIIKKPYFCDGCIIGCGNTIHVTEGPYKTTIGGGPEYEALALMGASCMVDNVEAICLANELCNRYGIDVIETGSLIAFAMEAFENGLITSVDTGGVVLNWGDPEAMLEVLRMIGEGNHIGELLNKGLLRAAAEIGKESEKYAMHVKGLAIPGHDPRAYNGLACSYATSSRGAHHMSGHTHLYEHRLKIPEIDHEPPGRFIVEGKGRLAALSQNIMNVYDSLKACKFAQSGGWTIGPLTEAFRYVTGRNDTIVDMIVNGERSFNLKRIINVDRGINRTHDTLPKRLLTTPKTAEGFTPNLPPLDVMLDEYYESRGWSLDGIPKKETMEKLQVI